MEALATGEWLTRERASRVAMISGVIGLCMIMSLWFARHATLDYFGQPVGSDFAAFWNAGWIANHADAARAWDQQLLNDTVRANHGVEYPTAWLYPPVFLLLAAPLGALPYLPALFLWQFASVVAVALLLKAILKSRHETLVALASPLTPLVLANGQNSFLTAALLGAGLLLQERRPALAGSFFGGLVYKPQLGLVIAPLLVFTRNWRAIAGAAVGAAVLVGLSFILWGAESWRAFASSLRYGRYFMEQGSVGFYKSASLFSMTRMWGAPVGIGYAVQSLGLLLAIWLIWHSRRAPWRVRAMAVCTTAALSTPYLLDYDMAVVAVGGAFLYAQARETGFLPYERSTLGFIWLAPLFSRPAAEFALLPFGPIAMVLMAWSVWRRALEHRHPAVDVQRLSGDVAGFFRREIDGGGADVVARAHLAQRDAR